MLSGALSGAGLGSAPGDVSSDSASSCPRLDGGDEAEPLSVHRPDEATFPARVVERLAQLLDAGAQRGVADETPGPEPFEQHPPIEHPLALLDQEREQGEQPWGATGSVRRRTRARDAPCPGGSARIGRPSHRTRSAVPAPLAMSGTSTFRGESRARRVPRAAGRRNARRRPPATRSRRSRDRPRESGGSGRARRHRRASASFAASAAKVCERSQCSRSRSSPLPTRANSAGRALSSIASCTSRSQPDAQSASDSIGAVSPENTTCERRPRNDSAKVSTSGGWALRIASTRNPPSSRTVPASRAADRHQRGEAGASLVALTQLDVGTHRFDEERPVGLEPGRTEHGHGGREAGGPGGVQERPELEVVVRVQVRDEDRRQLPQRQALLDQSARDAETAIDDDAPPVEHEQAGRRHGRARSNGRSTLGAEQHDLISGGGVHRRREGSAGDASRRRSRSRCARKRFTWRIIGDTVLGRIGVAVSSVARRRDGTCPGTVKRP